MSALEVAGLLEPEDLELELAQVVSLAAALQVAHDFLLSKRNPNTNAAYRRDLRQWFLCCLEDGVDPLAAVQATVDDWATQLALAGAKPATIGRKLASVSGYYTYAMRSGVLERNPVEFVDRPSVSKRSQTLGLDKADAERLLALAQWWGPVEHALVCLLMLNGLRVSEACAADVSHLSEQRGHVVLRIHGKGGRVDDAPLPPRGAHAVALARGERTSGPLLVWRGGRMHRQAAFRTIRRLSRHLGLAGISPHSLRHTAATMALDAGVDLRRVQEFMRHEDINNTVRYDRARRSLDSHPALAIGLYLGAAA